MRCALLCVLLFASGCYQNRSELEHVRDESQRILADEQKRSAALTSPRRADIEALMEVVRVGVEAMPELQKEIDALPHETPPVLTPLPPAPESGPFEGVEGARLRAEIAMLQMEVTELRRMTAAITAVDVERRRLEAAKKLIDEKRAR